MEIAYGFTKEFREKLYESKHVAAHEPFHLDIFKNLVFRHPTDASIAYLESDLLTEENIAFHEENMAHGLYDVELFDLQYLRYAQVLSTDYDSYMVVYSCQEGAHFYRTDSGEQIKTIDELLSHEFFERLPNPDPKVSPTLTLWNLTEVGEQDLRVRPVYMEKIQIL